MLVAERRAHILEMAERAGVVRIAELVVRFGISRMTARRDLDALVDEGLLESTRGGALAPRAPGATGLHVAEVPTPGAAAHQGVHVGMMVPTADYYYRDIIGGARRVLTAADATLSLVTCGYSAGRTAADQSATELARVNDLLELGATGLLLTPTVSGPTAESSAIDWIRDINAPVVLVEREPIRGGATSAWSVVTDVETGIVSAINHLLELGHKRIGLAIPSNAQPWRKIRQVWREYFGSRGYTSDVPVLSAEESPFSSARESGFIDGVLDMISDHNLTAVLCCNDYVALAVVEHARARGWKLPAELSVVAYDDEEVAEIAALPMTAVSPPKTEIGELAARTLLERMETSATRSPRRVRIEPQLIIRESTAAVSAIAAGN